LELHVLGVLAVKAAGEKAVAHCRAGKGPYILEMMTYRYRGHSMSDPAKYRTREEVEKIKTEKDCIEHVRDLLIQGGLASEDDLKNIDKVRSEVGMVFQHFNLFPHLTILENCTLAPIWVRKIPRREAEETAMHFLTKVNADIAIIEKPAKFEGRSMIMFLTEKR